MEKNNVLLQAFYANQVHFYHGDYVGFYCKQNHSGAESGTTLFQVQCKRGELAYPRCVERGKQVWTWGKAVGKVGRCSWSLMNRWIRVAWCSPGDCTQLWERRAESELQGQGRERPLWDEDEQCSTGMQEGHPHGKSQRKELYILTALMSPFTGKEPGKDGAGGAIENSKYKKEFLRDL